MNRIPALVLNTGVPAPVAGLTCRLPRLVFPRFITCLIAAVAIQTATADEPEKTFLDSVKSRAVEMRGRDEAPASLNDWQKRLSAIRTQLLNAWGGFPQEPYQTRELHALLLRSGKWHQHHLDAVIC